MKVSCEKLNMIVLNASMQICHWPFLMFITSLFHSCLCSPGFLGQNCTDVDDCYPQHGCQNGATCLDGDGNYTCVCTAEFLGPNCTDINDCYPTHMCNNGGTCVDGDGNHTCTCPQDFGGDFCDTGEFRIVYFESNFTHTWPHFCFKQIRVLEIITTSETTARYWKHLSPGIQSQKMIFYCAKEKTTNKHQIIFWFGFPVLFQIVGLCSAFHLDGLLDHLHCSSVSMLTTILMLSLLDQPLLFQAR